MYRQNTQLWQYTQDLIEAARSNAQDMKSKVSKLHEDLISSNRDRKEIANKLVLARDSEALIKQIYKNIGNTKFQSEEMERLCEEAEQSLAGAKSENEVLETQLKKKIEHLQLMHWQIDENTNREKFDQLMNTAEEFWYNNKTVLKSAYKRFRQGIGRQMRKRQLFVILRKVYDDHLTKYHFLLLKQFLVRRRFMHKSDTRRDGERRRLSMMRWRLYVAMEKVCNRARRRALMRTVFDTWTHGTSQNKWVRAYVLVHKYFLIFVHVFFRKLTGPLQSIDLVLLSTLFSIYIPPKHHTNKDHSISSK